MSYSIRAILAAGLLVLLPFPGATAGDSRDQSPAKRPPVISNRRRKAQSQAKADQEIPEMDLLKAAREGLVSVPAEGTGDGRMTVA